MQHLLSQLEIDILVNAVGDLKETLAAGFPSGYGNAKAKISYRDAEQGIVRANAAWSGLPTDDAAVRMKISRAYAGLEKRGLVHRIAMGYEGSKITHLRPTEAGHKLAEQIRMGVTTSE
jgi:hypothetical protein